MFRAPLRSLWTLLVLLTIPAGLAHAQITTPLDSTILSSLTWRSIGPANMMGRITDVEGIPSPSRTFFVAAAAGGIWKTTNSGTTFRPVFDVGRVIAMGDLAIAPSDTNIIWAGTGEEDSRNSISPGGGIYKSTDGGMTWAFMGLKNTETIGRIIVHPTNPDIVYVAALGAIWRSNPERGLYKTTDGGKTWEQNLFVSDKAGFVDVAMHPRNPNVLYASSWERVRGPYFLRSGGPGSALWKTTDGGSTWTEVAGGGFPPTTKGRIGLAIAPSNASIVYAMVEADTVSPRPSDAAPGAQSRLSGLYRSDDAGSTWTRVAEQNSRPFYYSQVRVDPKDPDRVYWSSTPVNFSEDGGKTVRTATQGIHVDHHAMWIDPNDANYQIIGNDGGVGLSFDRGGNFMFLNWFAVGQFYNISLDMAIPYHVCGGLQDNGSWCGPSRLARGSITNRDWFNVSGGDGFVTASDPTDPNIIYSESQGGNIGRLDYRSGQRSGFQKPSWRQAYQTWVDSIATIRGDTSRPLTRTQRRQIAALQARASADSAALDLRWNWNTPFFISPHNNHTLYMGANRVLKSIKQGDEMFPISPDLTTADTMKFRVSRRTTGGITTDATGAEVYTTIVSLAESPMVQGLLLVGTDDGKVWVTRNDRGQWEDLTGRFPGVPAETYVSRIEPSQHDSLRFYVTFDNHRRGDFTPYLYVTNDLGATFTRISNDLPSDGPDFVHVIREDPVNPNLLFVGTDVGVYLSTDRGTHWQRFMNGLPTVPVHDLKIHPRDHELVAGTHGRSIWIVDIAPLQQLTEAVLAADVHLFQPGPAFRTNRFPSDAPGSGDNRGHNIFRANSPPAGAAITYLVSKGAEGRAALVITDAAGDTVRTLNGPAGVGLHTVNWNFQADRRTGFGPGRVQDSLRLAEQLEGIVDSLVGEGADRAGLDSAQTQLLSGGFRRGFGGGGGGFGGAGARPGVPEFRDRPAEGPVVRGRGGRPGGAVRQLIQGLGGFGALQGLLPGRGGPPEPASPGTYLITLRIGDTVQRTTLTVAKVKPTGGLQTGELEG